MAKLKQKERTREATALQIRLLHSSWNWYHSWAFASHKPEGPAPQMHTVKAEHHGTEALPFAYTQKTLTLPTLSRP